MAHTHGVDLMQKLNDGRLEQVPSIDICKIRDQITFDLEELLEVGARIRPLFVGAERVGWVRGVHLHERKQLKRYISDNVELMGHILRVGTSLSKEYLAGLSAIELRSLLRVVTEMTNSDLRLYPYISAFVTTSTSEQLWHGRGIELTAFQKRKVELPDETQMTLLGAPDQARLWATLCTYREKAKVRLDGSMNALMIVRPWAGKGVDGLAAELKAVAKALLADQIEPWTEAIKVHRPVDVEDGWAHSEDDSVEGIQRELAGMLNNDRHERLIAKFETQQREKAEAQQRTIDGRIAERGGPGFFEEKVEILTAEQVKEQALSLRRSRSGPIRRVEEFGSNAKDKLSRYQ